MTLTPNETAKKVSGSFARALILAVTAVGAAVGIELLRARLPILADYAIYLHAALLFGAGYLIVGQAANAVYWVLRKTVDHPTAAAVRTIAKIAGIAILLSALMSLLNVNPSAALTVGSFSGLVVGFATQTVMSHAVAGIFLAFTRPFKHGDFVVISLPGNVKVSGYVKDLGFMHAVLVSEDGKEEIMLPNGMIVTSIITRRVKVTG